MRPFPWILVAVCALAGSPAKAVPDFGPVDYTVNLRATSVVDLSGDGSVAAGDFTSSPSTGNRAGFRAPVASLPFGNSEVLKLPGPSGRRQAWGISPDGNFVVGTIGLPPTISDQRAARWDASAGLTPERFDDPAGLDVFLSVAEDVANDGTSVGWVRSGGASGPIQPYRWLADGTPQELALLPNATSVFARAHGISGDGSHLAGVGRSDDPAGLNVAVRWVDGVPENLGTLPSDLLSWGWDLSLDGSTVVGWSGLGTREAIRWVEGVGMTSLGALPGSVGSGEALSVSADGSVVVGFGTTSGGEEAFIWDEVHGMRSVEEVLSGLGLGPDLSGWSLERATGLSADGLTLAGTGIDPNGIEKGWIATVPEPGTGSLLVSGLLVLARAKRRVSVQRSS